MIYGVIKEIGIKDTLSRKILTGSRSILRLVSL